MEGNNQQSTQPTIPVLVTTEQHAPAWLVVLLLLFFPPLALYFLYADKKYNSWIGVMLMIMGGISIVLNLFLIIFVVPQLTNLFNNLTLPYSSVLTYFELSFAILLSIGAIILGLILQKKLQDKNIYPKKLILISLIVLIIIYFFSLVITPIIVISPIYRLVNSIDNSTNSNVTPTPAPISAWKTYTTDDFEIKYPPYWSIEEYDKEKNSYIFRPDEASIFYQTFSGDMGIKRSVTLSKGLPASGKTLDDLIADPNTVKMYTPRIVTSKKVDINGYPAVRFCATREGAYPFCQFNLIKNDKVYQLTFPDGWTEKEPPETDEIFGQMLSTFKFTDQNQSIDTSTWKTYSGSDFSFLYPPGWKDETSQGQIVGFRISDDAVFSISSLNAAYDKFTPTTAAKKARNIIVGGRNAIVYELDGSGQTLPLGYSIIEIVIARTNTSSYSVVFSGVRNDINDNLIDQILSTFRFVQ